MGSGNDTTEEWDETDDEWLWGDYGYTLPLDDWVGLPSHIKFHEAQLILQDPLAPHTTGCKSNCYSCSCLALTFQ